MEILNKSMFCIFGYIDGKGINDGRFLLTVDEKSDGSHIAKILSNQTKLQEKLRSELQNCTTVNEIGQLMQVKHDVADYYQSSFLAAILEELENVGFERVVYLCEDFTKMHFCYNDSDERRHLLKITMIASLPLIVSDVEVELPEKFEFDENQSLTTLFESFVNFVDGFQEFWQEINTLDESDFISKTEDDTHGLASKTRRLILDKGVSVHLTINPKHPRALPEFSLSGPDTAAVSKLIDSKLDLWDEEKNILENLTEIFDGYGFSAGPTQRQTVIEAHCGICYIYESNKNEIPDQNCLQCKQQFHKSCLYEWLRKQASQRLSFGTVFGPCPYCSQTIKVKLAAF